MDEVLQPRAGPTMGVMLVRLDEGARVVGFDRVDEGGQIVRDLSVELDEADGMPSVASASDSADGRGSKPDAGTESGW